jgi:biopolymer transport protein ExbB
MRADCPSPWQGYQCEWSVDYLWHSMTWIVSLDVIVLALMLVYVGVVASRDSCLFYLALRQSRAFIRDAAHKLRQGAFEEVVALARTRRNPVATMVASGLTAFLSAPGQFTRAEATDAANRTFQLGRRKFVADTNLRLGPLKSIAATAPLLGLAGTCLGVLSAFRGVGMEKHAALIMMATDAAMALIPTAAGLLVVVPAIWSHIYLRTRIERLEIEMGIMAVQVATYLEAHSREKFPLTDVDIHSREIGFHADRNGRFGLATILPLRPRFAHLPPFALSGPVWLVLAAAFASFTSFHPPVGLSVRVLEPGMCATRDGPSSEPISVDLVETVKGETSVYVDLKEVTLEKFDDVVDKELRTRPQPLAYVGADRGVPWSQVASAIDAVKKHGADVVLLTAVPRRRAKAYAPTSAPSISNSACLRSTPQR